MSPEHYVLDSYALLAYFQDESGAEQVESLLRKAEKGAAGLYLTAVNLGEIYYRIKRTVGTPAAEKTLLIIDSLPVTIVEAGRELCLMAARIKGDKKMAYADCFAAACAGYLRKTREYGIEANVRVVTGDPEFKQVEDLVDILWLH